jgi:hypothetical protein
MRQLNVNRRFIGGRRFIGERHSIGERIGNAALDGQFQDR